MPYVEDKLLGEYYSPNAIRARAKRTATVDGLTSAQEEVLYNVMLTEVANGGESGFNWKVKQDNGVYHDGHERADVKADLHKHFLPNPELRKLFPLFNS